MDILFELIVAGYIASMLFQVLLIVISIRGLLKQAQAGTEIFLGLVWLPRRYAYASSAIVLVLLLAALGIMLLAKLSDVSSTLLHMFFWPLALVWIVWLLFSRWHLPYSLCKLRVKSPRDRVSSWDLNDPLIAQATKLIVPFGRRIVATVLALLVACAVWVTIHPFPLALRIGAILLVYILFVFCCFLRSRPCSSSEVIMQ